MIFKHDSETRPRAATARVVAACLFLLIAAASASAYTLVMRGGRRVEIPADFRLSPAQLTYETAPGFSVTVPLDLLDVAATERANGEPAGSFQRRAAATRRDESLTTMVAPGGARQPAARTLTNRELEAARRARVESERFYERRRAELALPSAVEMRRREREEEESMRERARLKEVEEGDAESYWRGRAGELRAEAGALDAETDYLRRVLAETANDNRANFFSSAGLSTGALTVITGPRQFGGFGRRGLPRTLGAGPFASLHPANFGTFQSFGGTRVAANVTLGTRSRARRGGFSRRDPHGQFAGRGTWHRSSAGFSRFYAPALVALSAPFDYRAADSSALVTRLRLLEAERAGVAERWRQLEEGARRAGAQPGWLRP